MLTRAPARGAAAGARRCRCVDCGRQLSGEVDLGALKMGTLSPTMAPDRASLQEDSDLPDALPQIPC